MAILDNLISYWKLDESSDGSGAVARVDIHGSNDLADINTTPSASGKIGLGAHFDNANSEYLDIADNASISTGDIDFSFTCWVNLDDVDHTGFILSKRNAGTIEASLFLDNASDTLYWGIGGSQTNASTFGALSASTWYFVYVYLNAATSTLGISINDGVVDTLGSITGTDTDGPFSLGKESTVGNYLDGIVDEVGFWKKVLSGAEVTELYNSGSGLAYPFGVSARNRSKRHLLGMM